MPTAPRPTELSVAIRSIVATCRPSPLLDAGSDLEPYQRTVRGVNFASTRATRTAHRHDSYGLFSLTVNHFQHYKGMLGPRPVLLLAETLDR